MPPTKEVKIGFNYRSPFHLEIKDGDVDIFNINSTVPFVPPGRFTAAQVFGGTSFSTKGSTTLEIPATATLGVSYTKDRLTLEVDADMTFWSSYKALNIDIQNNNPLLPDSNSPEEMEGRRRPVRRRRVPRDRPAGAPPRFPATTRPRFPRRRWGPSCRMPTS